jgi:hypothetical protein
MGKNGRIVNLATYVHLVLRLIISGFIPLLPTYAFTALTGTTAPLHEKVYNLTGVSDSNFRSARNVTHVPLYQAELHP